MSSCLTPQQKRDKRENETNRSAFGKELQISIMQRRTCDLSKISIVPFFRERKTKKISRPLERATISSQYYDGLLGDLHTATMSCDAQYLSLLFFLFFSSTQPPLPIIVGGYMVLATNRLSYHRKAENPSLSSSSSQQSVAATNERATFGSDDIWCHQDTNTKLSSSATLPRRHPFLTMRCQ